MSNVHLDFRDFDVISFFSDFFNCFNYTKLDLIIIIIFFRQEGVEMLAGTLDNGTALQKFADMLKFQVQYYTIYNHSREGEDIGLFIILVPKVL